MRNKIIIQGLLLLSVLITQKIIAQVAVNSNGETANTSAMLDVSSTEKGILIPRMTFSQMSAVSSPAQGLMVFVTTNNCFYSYDGTNWVKFLNTDNTDDDWDVSGNNVTVSSSKNIGIGTTSPTEKVVIYNTGSQKPLKIDNANESSDNNYGLYTYLHGYGSGIQYGNYVSNLNSGNNIHYGTYNNMASTGDGIQYGSYQYISNNGTANHYGSYNRLYGLGSGEQYGTFQTITNNGDAKHYASYNILSGSGSGNHFGSYNNLYGSGTGVQYGSHQYITNSGDNTHYGNYNLLSGSGAGTHYGSYNKLYGDGTGPQYGSYQGIVHDGDANMYATYNEVGGTGSGTHYAGYFTVSSTGSGSHYGTQTYLTGTSTGQQIGHDVTINNSGNGTHYGIKSSVSGSGSGDKYGLFSQVSSTAGGIHYGIYSWTDGDENYAAYFRGRVYVNDKVGIGTDNPTTKLSIDNTEIDTAVYISTTRYTSEVYGSYNQMKGSGTGKQYASFNKVDNTGNGEHYASYNLLTGLSEGKQYGTYQEIDASGSEIHYATYNKLTGSGSGNKYGSYNYISSSAGGTHYGVFSTVMGSANYAGYFSGRVYVSDNMGIGTTNPTTKLDIRGNILVQNNNDAVSASFESTVGDAEILIKANGAGDLAQIKFYNATTERGSLGFDVDNDRIFIKEGIKSIFIDNGAINPEGHKTQDLGYSGKAWDDIYYDDLHNEGAAAFVNRNVTTEILNFPPVEKLPGSFDYKTKRGDVELDPKSLPDGLHDETSILTDEVVTYNYKTNYEQQIQINELRETIKKQNEKIEQLLKLLSQKE